MEIDFSKIEIFNGVAHRSCTVADLREQFADVVYSMGQGVAAHALALKIFNSQGAVEYSEEECRQIRQFARLCRPAFIDAIERIMEG